nr:GspH/FimT family pseudopilin [Dyella sp. ASV24]
MNTPYRQQGARGAPDAGARTAGFTLVEMVVTLVIAAVLFALAVPSFRTMVLSNRLTTAANDMVDVIHAARIEAVKRNGSVQVCGSVASANGPGPLGEKCGVDAGAVYAMSIDENGNTSFDPIGRGIDDIGPTLKVFGDVTALRFNGQGMGVQPGTSTLYGGTVIDICTASLSADNHRIVQMRAGSVLQVDIATGTCT